MSLWRFVWLQMKPQQGLLMAAIGLRVLFRVLPLQIPVFTGALIDAASGRSAAIWGWTLPGGPASAMHQAGLGLVLTAAATGLAAFGSARTSAGLSRRLARGLQRQVIDAWQRGGAAARLLGSVRLEDLTLGAPKALGNVATRTLAEGIAASARFLYPAAMLLVIDPVLAILPLAALPLQALLTRIVDGKQSQLQDSRREVKERLANTVRDAIAGLPSGDLELDAEQLERERAESSGYSSLLTGAVWGLTAMALAATWWVGATRVAAGAMSLGDLVSFAGFVSFLALPLRRFAALAKETRTALKTLRRIRALLHSEMAASAPPVPSAAEEAFHGH